MSRSSSSRENPPAGRAAQKARAAQIADLRSLIAAAEQRGSGLQAGGVQLSHTHIEAGDVASRPLWQSGVGAIDQALPGDGLRRFGVHEFSGETYGDSVAAAGYLLTLLQRLGSETLGSETDASSQKPVLWCQTAKARLQFGPIYGAGLTGFGLQAQQFVFVQARSNNDLLWALEDGARSGALSAVIGDVDQVSFTQTRRLTLAAAVADTPVLLLRPHQDRSASAAETRWRIKTQSGFDQCFVSDPSHPSSWPKKSRCSGRPNWPGNPCWNVALTRCRGGRTGSFVVEFDYETHRLRLAERVSSRSAAPGPVASEQAGPGRATPEQATQFAAGSKAGSEMRYG